MNQKPLSYRDAGVDIDRGNRLVERIKHLAKATRRPELLGGVGGFGALFEIPVQRYRRPVLVSGADGVGTKLRLAISCGEHGTVGIDLVAMCVNDVLVHGAEPLYFLDYFATGRLDENVAEQVISGIARGCKLAGAALAGGETAEMPGMYADGDYDLAGFCVGVVEKDDIIDGRRVAPGDALIGIASSGPHSNGYSLIRKVLERSATPIETPINGSTLRELLLEPTRIYVSSVRALSGEFPVHAVAHVTGGGLVENLPRVLPGGVAAEIDTGAWPRPAIFDWLQQTGSIEDAEMWRTFNCGIGMVLCVPSECVGAARALLEKAGERTWHIGEVVRSAQPEARVILR